MEGFGLIAENIIHVRKAIQESIEKRRVPVREEVELIAVTKNHDIYAMRKAIDAGIRIIGENRIQEALNKAKILDRQVKWHLIGHLQTNKAKQAVELFSLIHSVDSERLALALQREAEKIGKVQKILLQVNIAGEDTKFGVTPEEALLTASRISQLNHLQLCGLMTIAPHESEIELTRPVFRRAYQMYTDLKNAGLKNADFQWLSMGMTNDYTVAVEEGSNLVRVGTGIFGQRQY